MYGRSTANQRIEGFWSQFKKMFSQYWINFFKDMIDEGIFDNSNPIHINCIQYCFMELLQSELNKCINEWNNHYIRKQKNAESPYGKPEILYKLPELTNSHECGYKIIENKVILCDNIYSIQISPIGCINEFKNIAQLINIFKVKPNNAEEAKKLYVFILNTLENFL
jgi:hypothetical protein